MDKTIEILLVAMVGIIAAVIVVALMTGQTDSFSGFLDTQSEDAKCNLWETQYENKFCGEDGEEGADDSDLHEKLTENDCGTPC